MSIEIYTRVIINSNYLPESSTMSQTVTRLGVDKSDWTHKVRIKLSSYQSNDFKMTRDWDRTSVFGYFESLHSVLTLFFFLTKQKLKYRKKFAHEFFFSYCWNFCLLSEEKPHSRSYMCLGNHAISSAAVGFVLSICTGVSYILGSFGNLWPAHKCSCAPTWYSGFRVIDFQCETST